MPQKLCGQTGVQTCNPSVKAKLQIWPAAYCTTGAWPGMQATYASEASISDSKNVNSQLKEKKGKSQPTDFFSRRTSFFFSI